MHADTYTVASAIQKGGSGKTTVALNTAGALASKGYKVLVIDLDSQGHATEGLGREDQYDADQPTIRSVLTTQTPPLASIICHADKDDIALLPSNASMIARPRVEQILGESAKNTEAAVRRLTKIIDESPAEVCIIDCPPSPGALTDVGLLASGRMLIPAKASGTSMRALELLLSKKRALESEFDVDMIQPVGVVANEVRHSGVSDDLLEWLDETFAGNVPVWILRKRVALERAWLNGATIYNHGEECEHAIEVFDSIAFHLEGFL